jgi:hypothetical protein
MNFLGQVTSVYTEKFLVKRIFKITIKYVLRRNLCFVKYKRFREGNTFRRANLAETSTHSQRKWAMQKDKF